MEYPIESEQVRESKNNNLIPPPAFLCGQSSFSLTAATQTCAKAALSNRETNASGELAPNNFSTAAAVQPGKVGGRNVR